MERGTRGTVWPWARRICPIAWRPNALAPVLFGWSDHGRADQAPGPIRVFYPSAEEPADGAAVLHDCGGYPLILLVTDAGDERRCFHLPAQLARAGYVVAVADLSRSDGSAPTEATRHLAEVHEWIRAGWPDRRVLAAALTGVVGHAGGAWPAARLAAEAAPGPPTVTARMWRVVTRALGRPPISVPIRAFASLGGEWSGAQRLLGDIAAAKLFVRSSAEPDVALFWDGLTPPKHAAVLEGLSHEDYLSDDAEDLEPLDHDEMLATRPPFSTVVADLVTMFFAKHLPPPAARTLPRHVSNHLVAPPLRLSAEQRVFAKGYHLAGITRLTRAGGRVVLSHETRRSSATVSLPTIAP